MIPFANFMVSDIESLLQTAQSSLFCSCFSYEKSLQALSKYGRMDAVELEKEIDYEIS